jgi:ATP-dependent RNA helicase DeaD
MPSLGDAIAAQGKNIENSISAILTENKHLRYMEIVNNLSGRFSLADISAAALQAAFGELPTEMQSPERGRDEDTGGKVRLFMTIGKMDKIKVQDIVNSIAAEAGIPQRKIENVRVLEKFTFLEVPADLADRVIRSINDMVLKGRKVKVAEARK